MKRSRVRITRSSCDAAPLRARGSTAQMDDARRIDPGTSGQTSWRGSTAYFRDACNKADKLSLDYLVSLSAKAGLTVAGKLAA
ncbi:MAG TPA: hypothetical protein PKD12_10065 [Nitrospira sp.]|nr:hypothetical protein [Nitrospira sp.]